MNKNIFKLIFVIILIAASSYYYLSRELKPPADWQDSILLRKYASAMGAKTVTTVYKDGKVLVVSDFHNKGGSYFLELKQVNKLRAMILSAGTKIRTFKPQSGVLYDTSFSLETNVEKYLYHTATDEQLQAILDYINVSKKAIIR